MTVARTSCAMGPTGATRARDANAVKKNGACRGARSSTGCRDASCRRRWNTRGSVYAIWWTGRGEPGAVDPRELPPWFAELRADPPPRFLAGDDPRLPAMPEKPTLIDYFTHRFGPCQHLLQSARLARQNGCDEKIVLACLLHDISVYGLLVPDHGYWGAQLIAPYVDEEVAWAVRYPQALRFYADEDAGYAYP